MNTDKQMPQYQCHKKVWALKIKNIKGFMLNPAEDNSAIEDMIAFLEFEDVRYGPRYINEAYFSKHKPEAGGYFVQYEDGYESFSPAEVFEGGYTEIKSAYLTFGEATAKAKAGEKICRAGWNGKGMYAYFVPANSYPAVTKIARQEFGEMVPYKAYWALKTVQNDVAAWTPSGTDTLAEDWYIIS